MVWGCAFATPACEPPGAPAAWPAGQRPVKVSYVIDGDTVILADKRRVRLIGIDTSEIGRDGKADQPFARVARHALVALIDASGDEVRLIPGQERLDRYGRTLAHLFSGDGDNLVAELLRQGLGYHIAFPPNLAFLDCYAESQAAARAARLGLWSLPAKRSHELPRRFAGFARVRGRVKGVRLERDTILLRMSGDLTLRVAGDDRDAFDLADLLSRAGQNVEVSGWIYPYHGRLRMKLRHPSALFPLRSETARGR